MIKSILKSFIKKILITRGSVIKPYNEYEEKLEKVKYNWLLNQNINTVIDIGASDGGYAMKVRNLFPHAKIFSFEPIPESYKKLNDKFKSDENFKAFNIAVGNTTGKSEFYQNNYVGSSSFLEMSTLHIDAYPYTKDCSKIEVNVDKLDNIIKANELVPNVILKIDVQGYEKYVLEGAEDLLKNIKIIFTEVSFNSLYKSQWLFNEIIDFLKERGFIIGGIENISQSLQDGTFLQADVFFIRNP